MTPEEIMASVQQNIKQTVLNAPGPKSPMEGLGNFILGAAGTAVGLPLVGGAIAGLGGELAANLGTALQATGSNPFSVLSSGAASAQTGQVGSSILGTGMQGAEDYGKLLMAEKLRGVFSGKEAAREPIWSQEKLQEEKMKGSVFSTKPINGGIKIKIWDNTYRWVKPKKASNLAESAYWLSKKEEKEIAEYAGDIVDYKDFTSWRDFLKDKNLTAGAYNTLLNRGFQMFGGNLKAQSAQAVVLKADTFARSQFSAIEKNIKKEFTPEGIQSSLDAWKNYKLDTLLGFKTEPPKRVREGLNVPGIAAKYRYEYTSKSANVASNDGELSSRYQKAIMEDTSAKDALEPIISKLNNAKTVAEQNKWKTILDSTLRENGY